MGAPNRELLAESGAKTYSGMEKLDKLYDVVMGFVETCSNVFDTITENWKIAAIGVVALAVLLKD